MSSVRWTPEEDKLLLSLWNAGLSGGAAADVLAIELGVAKSDAAIHVRLRRLGARLHTDAEIVESQRAAAKRREEKKRMWKYGKA